MAKIRVHLTFPQDMVKEPIIFNLGKKYDVVTNIRRANVEEDFGWVVLEVTGDPDDLEKSIDYLRESGIEVSPIEGDIVES